MLFLSEPFSFFFFFFFFENLVETVKRHKAKTISYGYPITDCLFRGPYFNIKLLLRIHYEEVFHFNRTKFKAKQQHTKKIHDFRHPVFTAMYICCSHDCMFPGTSSFHVWKRRYSHL